MNLLWKVAAHWVVADENLQSRFGLVRRAFPHLDPAEVQDAILLAPYLVVVESAKSGDAGLSEQEFNARWLDLAIKLAHQMNSELTPEQEDLVAAHPELAKKVTLAHYEAFLRRFENEMRGDLVAAHELWEKAIGWFIRQALRRARKGDIGMAGDPESHLGYMIRGGGYAAKQWRRAARRHEELDERTVGSAGYDAWQGADADYPDTLEEGLRFLRFLLRFIEITPAGRREAAISLISAQIALGHRNLAKLMLEIQVECLQKKSKKKSGKRHSVRLDLQRRAGWNYGKPSQDAYHKANQRTRDALRESFKRAATEILRRDDAEAA